MKIRNGFVSNSSSSSFVVKLNDLTAKEAETILDFNIRAVDGYSDYWTITKDNDCIRGFTVIDNDEFSEYLEKNSISTDKFTWESC